MPNELWGHTDSSAEEEGKKLSENHINNTGIYRIFQIKEASYDKIGWRGSSVGRMPA